MISSPYSLIEIRKSLIHGRGVFAKYMIHKGHEITCEIIVVPDFNHDHPEYYYPWSGKDWKSMAIGFGFFLNHSEEPNMIIHKTDKENLTMTFKALRDIKPRQELFIHYGGEHKFGVK